MRRQSRVLPGKDPTRVSRELPEQVHVVVGQRVLREINLGLGARSATFRRTTGTSVTVLAVRMSFAGHDRLLDLAMQRVTTQKPVVLFLL